ncbi:MAG: Hpt domain-containing protein, partial [Halanaeroarchaeum sp.]
MDEYLEAFVREGEEHVTDLNNALLTLENDPEDEEAMDQIFRTAHTLKGNFGAMGFEDASDLAHAVEDLLDGMRQGEISVTSDRMDHIFAGIDEIEACLDEIEASGEVTRNVRPTIDDLRSVLEESEGTTASDDAPPGESTPEVERETPFDATALEDVQGPVFHVEVDMGDSDMPGVDAMFVLDDVKEEYDIVDSDPDVEAIEDGEYDGTFDLAIETEAADVGETIARMGRVTNATASEIRLAESGTDQTATDQADTGSATDQADT